MHETTRAKALDALEGMRQIVRAEMLTTDVYVEDEVSDKDRIDAICGGRKHCAIGALWVGGGVGYIKRYGELDLPGARQQQRDDFLRPRHGLRVAYEALNAAAASFAQRRSMQLDSYFTAPIEGLFEGNYNSSALTKRDLLGVIAAAKRSIKAAS